MSGTGDLKDLLERLKDEVGPLPPEPQREALRQKPPDFRRPVPERPGRPQRPYRPDQGREVQSGAPRDTHWSENKEAMLFGMLTSLVAAFGGILSGLDYLVLIGAVVFMLFSFMLLLSLFGSYLNSRRSAEGSGIMEERLETLSRKVEALNLKNGVPGKERYAAGDDSYGRELDRKVEELRILVKSLAKAVDGRNG